MLFVGDTKHTFKPLNATSHTVLLKKLGFVIFFFVCLFFNSNTEVRQNVTSNYNDFGPRISNQFLPRTDGKFRDRVSHRKGAL